MKTYYLHICWEVQLEDGNIAKSDGLYIVKAKRGSGLYGIRKCIQEQLGSNKVPNIINMTVLPKKLYKAFSGQ